MAADGETLTQGNNAHPEHEAWLLGLGRAHYASARLAQTAVDVLRSRFGEDYWDVEGAQLAPLAKRITRLARGKGDQLAIDYADQLEAVRSDRNDLVHALPVLDGLHRRRTADHSYVRNFFAVSDFEEFCAKIDEVNRLGGALILPQSTTT